MDNVTVGLIVLSALVWTIGLLAFILKSGREKHDQRLKENRH